MAEYVNLKITVEDRIGLLTIDHPPANAVSMQRRWRSWTVSWMSFLPMAKSKSSSLPARGSVPSSQGWT
jgi:hypothetical protein